jgi:hypothetical protein
MTGDKPAAAGEAKPAETPTASKNDTPKQEHPKQKHQFKNNQRRAFKMSTDKDPQFEGKCEDLSGYTYDCSDPRLAADMYTKTTNVVGVGKEIAEHVG